MRESHTAVLERHARLSGAWQTEPYETAWAIELIYFVYLTEPLTSDVRLQPQISADGQRWINDGESFALAAGRIECAVKCRHFGGFSRLDMRVPEAVGDCYSEVDVYLTLKG